ncbi:hypothetical protein QQP08_027870 [Theobroma cacao]|nr:hypothetical protein QQP08_027870 [Theobroma cacao]
MKKKKKIKNEPGSQWGFNTVTTPMSHLLARKITNVTTGNSDDTCQNIMLIWPTRSVTASHRGNQLSWSHPLTKQICHEVCPDA